MTEIKDLINVSITGGSGLPLLKFADCPMKVKNFLDGWRLKKIPYKMGFGILVHEAEFEDYFKEEREKPEDVFMKKYKTGKVFSKETETDQEINKEGMSDEDIAKSADLGMKMVVTADKNLHGHEIKEVEKKVITEIINPENGHKPEQLAEFRLKGTIDINQNDAVADMKTTRSELKPEQIQYGAYALQLETYRYIRAAASNGNDIPKVVRLFGLTKHKEPRWQELENVRNDEDMCMLFDWMQGLMLRMKGAIMTDKWEKNLAACHTMYGMCQYYPICHKNKFNDWSKEAGKTMFRKEK